jgi:hypothetical protein
MPRRRNGSIVSDGNEIWLLLLARSAHLVASDDLFIPNVGVPKNECPPADGLDPFEVLLLLERPSTATTSSPASSNAMQTWDPM